MRLSHTRNLENYFYISRLKVTVEKLRKSLMVYSSVEPTETSYIEGVGQFKVKRPVSAGHCQSRRAVSALRCLYTSCINTVSIKLSLLVQELIKVSGHIYAF